MTAFDDQCCITDIELGWIYRGDSGNWVLEADIGFGKFGGVDDTVCPAMGRASVRIRSGVCCQYFRTITLESDGKSRGLLETQKKIPTKHLRLGIWF